MNDTVNRWEMHIGTMLSGVVLLVLSIMWNADTDKSHRLSKMETSLAVIQVKVANALTVQSQLVSIQREHGQMASKISLLVRRMNGVVKEQEREDVREREEHGGFK